MEVRIHFVQQSIHLLTHMGPETFRISPLACYAQWTLETAIGNLGREIRQDMDLFANLTQQAVMRAQVNSLYARFPRIEFEVGRQSSQSSHRCEFEPGFLFLPRCEECPSPLSEDELSAFKIYWGKQEWPNADAWPMLRSSELTSERLAQSYRQTSNFRDERNSILHSNTPIGKQVLQD